MHPKNGMHELVGQTRTNFSDDKHVKPWLPGLVNPARRTRSASTRSGCLAASKPKLCNGFLWFVQLQDTWAMDKIKTHDKQRFKQLGSPPCKLEKARRKLLA